VGDDVTISVVGDRLITLSGAAQSIRSLTLDERLAISGTTLTLATTAQISNAVTLNSSGVLKGGTVSGTGSIVAVSGTLDGVALNAGLDLTTLSGAGLFVKNGLVLNATAGVGKVDGTTYGLMYFGDSTVAPAGSLTGTGTILFGGSTNNGVNNYSSATGATGTLTVGSGITIHGKNGSLNNVYATGTIVNQGTYSADVSGGTLRIGGTGTLRNDGTMSALNGGTLVVAGPWTNAAPGIVSANGSTLTLGSGASAWSNAGTINVTNSTVNLDGSFTQAALGTFNRSGGTVNLTGTVTGNLSLGAATGSWNVNSGGTVRNGTYSAAGGAGLSVNSGVFDNVTVSSPVDLLAVSNASLTIKNGLVLNSTLNVGKVDGTTYGSLLFGDATANPAGSLSGTGTIVLGGSTNNNVYDYSSGTGAAGTLTIGPGILIRGKSGQISTVYGTATIVNQGTIAADVSGGTITVGGAGALLNQGTMSATNGATLSISGAWTNSAGATITATGAALKLGSAGDAWNNLGTINATDTTVTLGGNFTQAAVGTLNRTGGAVNVVGVLTGNLGLNATTGSWNVVGATLRNGTYSAAGGASLVINSATFDGMTVAAGAVADLSPVSGASLTIKNSLVLNGTLAVGKVDGTTYGQVYFGDATAAAAGSLTGTGTVVFGGSTNNNIYNYSSGIGVAGTLTIGPEVTVRGKSGKITNVYTTATLLNQGTVWADTEGGTVTFGDASGAIVNAGALAVSNNGTLTVAGQWSNTGTISVNNGTLNLGGNVTGAGLGLGGFTRTGGTVNLTGTVTGNLPLTAATGTWNLVGGQVRSGTLSAAGGASLVVSSGIFDGVSVAPGTTVDVSMVSNASLGVRNSLTLDGAMLLGRADGATYGGVNFGDGTAATPAGALTGAGVVTFGGSTNNGLTNTSAALGEAGVLTLGAGITVHGKSGSIDNQFQTGEIVSQGTIAADVSGGTLKFGGTGTVTNNGVLSVGPGATMTIGGTSGSWSNAGTVAVNDGTLNLGGNFATLTLNLGGFTRSGAASAVNLTGTLDNFGSTLALSAATGSWRLSGGTIRNGTFSASGGAGLLVTSGIFDGLTLNTGADLTTVSNASLVVKNGLVLNGVMPVGRTDGATYGQVYFGDSTATTPAGNLAGAGSILFGASTNNSVTNYSSAVGGPATLTIGSGITIHGHSGSVDNNYATGKILNNGTIAADVLGGTVKVGGTGTLTNGATGLLAAANGGTLTVGGVWSNTGTLSVDNATLNLAGQFTSTGLGLSKFVRNGGTVNLSGTLTGNLPLTATTGSWNLAGGTLKNGTYTASGGSVLSVRSGTFDGVTVGSDLDVTPISNSSLTLKNGLVLNGVMSIGRTDGSTYGQIYFGEATAAPSGALTGTGQIVFGGNVNNSVNNYSTGLAAAGTLTIGSGIKIRGASGSVSSTYATGSILSQGVISADTAGETITLGGTTFTNAGTAEAVGGNLTVAAGNFVNNGTMRVTAGTLTFNSAVNFTPGAGSSLTIAGGTMQFNNNPLLPTFDLSVGTLTGSGTMTASALSWTAGTMAGTGKTVVPAAGTLVIGGAATKTLSRRFDNAGTASWTDGQVSLTGGTFNNLAGGVFNASAANTFFAAGGTNAFVNSGAFSKTSSSVTIFGVPFVNLAGGQVFVNDGTLVFAGGGSNIGSIEVAAGATARFSGNYVHAAGSSLVSHGNLDFNASTVSLDGNLTIDGELAFNSATATVKANATATSIALINSNATVAAGGVLGVGAGGISFGGTNNNSITLQPSATTPGKLLLGGNVSFTATGGSGALNTADFTVSQTPGLLDLGGANRTFTVNDAPAAVDLAVSARIVNGSLAKSGPGTLRLDSPNTYAGGTTVNAGTLEVIDTAALGSGAVTLGDATLSLRSDGASPVVFGSAVNVVGDGTVRVDRISTGSTGTFRLGAVGVGPTRLAVSGSNGRSLEITSLNLSGNATLDTSVPLTVSGPITQTAGGFGFTKSTGLAKLTIGGTTANTYTGLTRVNDGAVELNKPAGVTAVGGDLSVFGGSVKLLASDQIADTSNVTIANAGTLLDLNGRSETVGGLTMTGGQVTTGTAAAGPYTVFRATALALSGAARFDLGNNRMIIDYAGASPAASIRAAILSAKGTGNWAGPGLTSNLLAVPANQANRAIGFAEASAVLGAAGGTFAGQAVDGSAVLVRYTVQGDATLDGTVNFDDLLLLAKSYNATGPTVTWGGGDFDYSGTVNFDDLLVLAKNYNAVLPGGAAIPGATAAFDADVAAAFAQAAVPEPSGMMFVGAIGAAMAAGRRRRQRAPQGPPRLPV
jgi:hypothetical protein